MPKRNRLLNFDIDHYLNRVVPRSFVHRLPQPIAHFLGYRKQPPQVNNLLVWSWAFLGAFCGISLIEGVTRSSPWIQSVDAPLVIASYGASAILEYNTIDSPLAQPRNVVFGQFLSAFIGVAITKLFHLLPSERFEDLRWLAGALSVATASFVMGVTKTIHPPAGASALLAATNAQVTNLGWSYLPLILISSLLMLGSACILNNVQRQFPQYWWTPKSLSPATAKSDPVVKSESERPPGNTTNAAVVAPEAVEKPALDNSGLSISEVRINEHSVELPDWLDLDDTEMDFLRTIQGRLRPNASSSSDAVHA